MCRKIGIHDDKVLHHECSNNPRHLDTGVVYVVYWCIRHAIMNKLGNIRTLVIMKGN